MIFFKYEKKENLKNIPLCLTWTKNTISNLWGSQSQFKSITIR